MTYKRARVGLVGVRERDGVSPGRARFLFGNNILLSRCLRYLEIFFHAISLLKKRK